MRRAIARSCAALLIAGTGVAVTACGGDESTDPPPTAVGIAVAASPFLNPDRNNRPSPVVVRIYGLTEDTAFNDAGFFDLYEKDQDVLGDAIKSSEEFIIAPGDVTELNVALPNDAAVLAVLAAFRNINDAQFRATTPIHVPGEPVDVTIKLQSNSIKIEAPEAPIVVDSLEELEDLDIPIDEQDIPVRELTEPQSDDSNS